jgi:Family of unknown function (DUF6460)
MFPTWTNYAWPNSGTPEFGGERESTAARSERSTIVCFAGRYFLLGAILVVPIWLLVRLARAPREHG